MTTQTQDRAQALAESHWEYINELLRIHDGIDDETIRMCQFHYKSAFVHGYKHGVEDMESRNAD